ncbi:2-alkenal reductase (NADP(+)-dependent)-like [Oryza glaberrima]|uniref:Enoyl reductase (ER) domain-containing protein n=1 Tax=Oryza glaberrima TaxID=4538 RepID=I1QZ18_ORYGL|nr:2-alkenal reductase (NADP(+)-dependent)-like [Oryza glaberrima]
MDGGGVDGYGMKMVRNRKVVLRRYVTAGYPIVDDMEVVSSTVMPRVPLGTMAPAVMVKNIYLSCDPWMRGRMTKHDDATAEIAEDFVLGEAMVNFGVSKVVDSTHPVFAAGDLVWGLCGWEEYSLITQPETLHKINHPDLPLSYYTGVLGVTGLTAYAAFFEVGKPKKGETVFVSAASGAVGQIVGQLAKIAGCYVVGSAGSDEKVTLLKTKFGFHDAFNYKKEGNDLTGALRRCFPDGIDIYFDNVGGATLDAALVNMRRGGRVVVCGMISQYNLQEPEGVHNVIQILSKTIRVEGFAVFNHFGLYPMFEDEMARYLKEGKVTVLQDVVKGIEKASEALIGMFSGRNVGKLLVAVADE